MASKLSPGQRDAKRMCPWEPCLPTCYLDAIHTGQGWHWLAISDSLEAEPKQGLFFFFFFFVPLSLAGCHLCLWHQGREEPHSLNMGSSCPLTRPQGPPSSLAPVFVPMLDVAPSGASNSAFPFPSFPLQARVY